MIGKYLNKINKNAGIILFKSPNTLYYYIFNKAHQALISNKKTNDVDVDKYIKDGFFDGWALLMQEMAKQEHVFCKVSGMITEADYKTWSPAQLTPYMDLVLNAFGTSRIMYGSDWPVCLVAGNYSQVKTIVTDFITELSVDEQEAIMSKNAIQFYNL